jgi:branched-chain amino acid transport system permease protein
MEKPRYDWAGVFKLGLLGGVIALYLCLVGLVATFGESDIIGGVITLGHALPLLTTLGIGYVTARQLSARQVSARQVSAASSLSKTLLGSALAGLLSAVLVALLVIIADRVNVREMFINVSPELIDMLTFGQGVSAGIALLLLGGALIGVVGGGVYLLPGWANRSLLAGVMVVVPLGVLRDILRVVLTGRRFLTPVSKFVFAAEGMTQKGAIVLGLAAFGLTAAWLLVSEDARELLRRALLLGVTSVLVADLSSDLSKWLVDHKLSRVAAVFPEQGLTLFSAVVIFALAAGLVVAWSLRKQTDFRWVYLVCGVILILILPFYMRDYLTNVMDRVGLYILMGLGLNIVVGFAGLLDLGYVAFFAIGAYTMGVLTTTGDLGGAEMSFWVALPISIAASVLAGLILGVPVLNMRGDYLAIVTLGFGEIIRVLAISNWLKPYIGGALGVIPIPRPSVFGSSLATFQSLYYLILAGCLVALFISWRLRDSRAGRTWMALREDEDVAQAMGIDLVKAKLLAFAVGAAFAGTGGAIFASQVSSIYPHSFNIMISINILSLIIVGGIGSLPGVVVGSLFLVGLPEVLSELQEYRLLFYGAALVLMMLVRPEGLWPEATRKRELYADDEQEEVEL